MMRTRISIVLLLTLLLLLALVAVSPAQVSAIADPDTAPTVNSVYVYEDCLEDGDVGVLVDYYLDYAVLPTEPATDSYLAVFVDTDGTTQLKSVAPYTYYPSLQKGYGRGLIWIYFTAAEATTYSLDAADMALYRVWLTGNPTIPSGWPNPLIPPKTVATVDYWQTAGDTAVLIALRVLWEAETLEPLWSAASLSMITMTVLGSKLGTDGEEYFCNVIPRLREIAPAAFADNSLDPEDTNADFTTSFGAVMANGAAPTGGTVTGSPITFTNNKVTGVADAGTNIALDDAALTQADDYWNGSRLIIISTTDGLAPQGETALITNFDSATDRLSFAALTAAVGVGDTYSLCTGLHSTVDSGTTTTIQDSNLAVHNLTVAQANDYWNGARVIIVSTTDGAAPEGETSTVTDFAAATNRITFGALTAALGEGDTYVLSFTSVSVTVAGTFTITLNKGTYGIVTSIAPAVGGGTVDHSTVDLVEGVNTINVPVGGTGTLTVFAYLDTTQSKAEDDITGTAFDLSDAAAKFGMSRMWFSTLVWLIMSILVCAATYRVSGYGGGYVAGLSSGKITMLVFNLCIIGGAILGLVSMLVAILLFLIFGVFIGYVIFFKQANV